MLAGISWDRGLLLFAPRRRTKRNSWIICSCAALLSALAAIPAGMHHNIVAYCGDPSDESSDDWVRACSLVVKNATGGIVHDACEGSKN